MCVVPLVCATNIHNESVFVGLVCMKLKVKFDGHL